MGYIVKLSDLPDKLDSIEPILDKIVEGDCLKLLNRLPSNSIDLTLTDPPYGVNLGSHLGGKETRPVFSAIALLAIPVGFAPLCRSGAFP